MYFVPVGDCQFVGCSRGLWWPNVADEVVNSLVYGCGNKINLSRHLLYVLSAGVVKGMCRRVCRIGCVLSLPSVYFDVLNFMCCFLGVVLLHVRFALLVCHDVRVSYGCPVLPLL